MKPLIGINLDIKAAVAEPDQLRLNATYLEAIRLSGGIPLLISPMPDDDLHEVLNLCSGLLLTGGQDYDPALYGRVADSTMTAAHPTRQDFDLRLARKALLERDIPILGICAGHQLINIVLGGTLIQDIETAANPSQAAKVEHGQPDGEASKFSRHEINFEAGSCLKSLYKQSTIKVPSAHHQAVDDLGKGLRVSSRSADKLIESIELNERSFTVGVQWHPERDFSNNSQLFVSFISAAAN